MCEVKSHIEPSVFFVELTAVDCRPPNLQLSFASGVLVYFSYGLHHSTLNVPRHVTHARTTEDAVALLDILDANTDDDS